MKLFDSRAFFTSPILEIRENTKDVNFFRILYDDDNSDNINF